MLFTAQDRERIGAAIGAAEADTAGEIVVIVSTASHRYGTTALSLAALVALAVPVVAVLSGWSPAALNPGWTTGEATSLERRSLEVLILVQTAVFVAVLALGWWTPLARLCTPHGLRRDRVHKHAMVQFRARGLEATAGRTGVLLYIDEPEHIAEVIADTAVFEKVPAEHWADTIDALTAGIARGEPAEGMVTAISRAGAVLAAHFPPATDNRNELPDRMIEI